MGGGGSLICVLFYEDTSARTDKRGAERKAGFPRLRRFLLSTTKRPGHSSMSTLSMTSKETTRRSKYVWLCCGSMSLSSRFTSFHNSLIHARYPTTTMSLALQHSHVYVCKRASILDLLMLKPKLEPSKEEFVPWVCKLHSQKRKRVKYD